MREKAQYLGRGRSWKISIRPLGYNFIKGYIIFAKWAVIDIETTGIDAHNDEIIELGYLQFEGTKLVGRYSSLVRYEFELSQFIQKLTGIKSKQLKKAPPWKEVECQLAELEGHALIAHNAAFEKSFLKSSFDKVSLHATQRESFLDTMLHLGALYPERSKLSLESFIVDFKIKEKEAHRGLEDSEDLLKVLLMSQALLKNDPFKHQFICDQVQKYGLYEDYPLFQFFHFSDDDCYKIAEQIDFNLDLHLQQYLDTQIDLQKNISTFDTETEKISLEFSKENIQHILQDEARIKHQLPFYDYRKSQEDLSIRVGQSFKNNVHALIQAPTGVGKTIGYLLPSALYSLSGDQQVLVSTGTKTLQNQAITKDVPQLYKLLGIGQSQLKVALLMGSQNHLCEVLYRRQNNDEDLLLASLPLGERLARLYFDMVFYYNGQDENQQKIMRGDLSYGLKRTFEEIDKLDKQSAVDFRACTGSKCPYKGQCSYIQGLQKAKEANIILGNHSMMFTWPKGITRPTHIIVDEAHKIESEATSAFTKTFSQEGVETLAKQLISSQGLGPLFYLISTLDDEGFDSDLISELKELGISKGSILQEHLEELKSEMELYFKKAPRYTSHYWNELPMLAKNDLHETLSVSLFNRFESIRFILEDLYQTLCPYVSKWEVKDLKTESDTLAYTRFESFLGSLEDHYEVVKLCLSHDKEMAHSMKYHESFGYALESAPINIGKVVHDQLLKDSDSVVFTSATLANANGERGAAGVEWMTGYRYLEGARRFKQGLYLPAVYDYEKNAKIFLCDNAKSFYDLDFVEKTLAEIFPVIRSLNGRSLILFSARKRFEEARELLLREFDGEIPLFIQGMGQNVVEDYKKSENGILLGMESFGEGIDIPGDALKFVFIDKIPDLRMDYIINQRRDFYQHNIGNEFTDYFLSYRTRGLHQKLGRLLRTQTDHGGAIIVDSRIKNWKHRTQDTFNDLMKPYVVNRTSLKEACQEIVQFMGENTQK